MDTLVFDFDNEIASGSGMHKHLSVYEDRVELRAEGSALTNGLQGEKTIYYSDCTGVQFKLATRLFGGYVQFETASIAGQGDPYKSENSVPFRNSQNDLMTKVVEYVKDQIRKAKSSNGGTVINEAPSSADELLKFKQLFDAGVITQEEFDAKKKQLLGL